MCYKYAYAGPPDARASVYSIIMGSRPADVPKEWIIDHADRNKVEQHTGNLRGCHQASTPGMRAHGQVHFALPGRLFTRRQWCMSDGAYIGLFATEREPSHRRRRASARRRVGPSQRPSRRTRPPGACCLSRPIIKLHRRRRCARARQRHQGPGIYETRNDVLQANFRCHLGTFKTFEGAVAFRAGTSRP
jgi:hypothetical protein